MEIVKPVGLIIATAFPHQPLDSLCFYKRGVVVPSIIFEGWQRNLRNHMITTDLLRFASEFALKNRHEPENAYLLDLKQIRLETISWELPNIMLLEQIGLAIPRLNFHLKEPVVFKPEKSTEKILGSLSELKIFSQTQSFIGDLIRDNESTSNV
jgi:hypothetical protein